ncbi:ubiquitin carboxyl-terminal hydrolase MINDY-2 isoform X3 [Mobula hypostoma]|uniref:ubiquitin carboxyl-terminal hydrolase MINDY-2 isoform X3 n=1 Tax=Mobula hypostoma TaxID=723540 RepID=UPI002FC39651
MESNAGAERGDGVAVEGVGAGPAVARGDGSGERPKGTESLGAGAAASSRSAAVPAHRGAAAQTDAPCSNGAAPLQREENEGEEEGTPGREEKVRDGPQQNLVNKMSEVSEGAATGPRKDALPGLALQPTNNQPQEECSPIETPDCDKNHSASDQSLPGESRSIDSLESFSNLNSCPSSDLNSEGTEDRGLALTLQSEENNKDGVAKPSGSKERFPGQSVYHIKWIKWKTENTPIITQNENGPCPLLAIMNVLLLAWKIKLPPMIEIITAEQLMEYLGDYILDAKPKEITDAQRLNYEQNADLVKAVGMCSYNQLVEKIIFCKQSENSELVSEGYVAEQFLNNSATQLTYHGLCELISTVEEGELCVFFRNNHFSTMTKYKGQLYLLVTDQGFLTEEKVVWESLHNVDGDGNFCDSNFHLRPPSDPETVYKGQQDQIDQDYLMALSLQQEQQSQDLTWEQIPEGISDLELAKKLQEEEDRRASQYYHEQEQAAVAQSQEGQQSQAAATAGKQSGGTERKQRKEAREKEKDKCILL